MSLMNWRKPTSERGGEDIFTSLQKDINDLFNGFWMDTSRSVKRGVSFSPRVEFKETPSEFLLNAELPGFDKNDIQISLDGNLLTIRGERKIEEKKEEDRVHYSEINYGMFERAFTLPEGQINKDNIVAKFDKGMLALTLSKKPEAIQGTKKIEIE